MSIPLDFVYETFDYVAFSVADSVIVPWLLAICRQGIAEYCGGRYFLTQRLLWDGDWKFVYNGFDYDELYNLAADPFEMNNLAQKPAHARRIQAITRHMWRIAVNGLSPLGSLGGRMVIVESVVPN